MTPEVLFNILWTEIDFDDHLMNGPHSPSPQGELEVPDCTHGVVSLNDERVRLSISADILSLKEELKRQGEMEAETRPHHMFVVSKDAIDFSPSVLQEIHGLHKWSIPIDWFEHDSRVEADSWFPAFERCLQRISAIDDFAPEYVIANVPVRQEMRNWRERFSPHLPDWTWHLEVDNKPDRCGWYIRAPENSDSLFTIFMGLGWNPDAPRVERGFFIFERAPEGELDREDESRQNLLDVARTKMMCGKGGLLHQLATDSGAADDWADSTKRISLQPMMSAELYPPSMGLWPLLMGRSAADISSEEMVRWFSGIIEPLLPVLEEFNSQ